MAHKNHTMSREQSLEYYTEQRKRRGRRKVVFGIIGGILVATIVAVVAVGMYMSRLNTTIITEDEDLLSTLKKPVEDEPFYLLLLGADKGEERYEDVGEDESLYRADSIMLCRIDPNELKVTLVSIHRDLYVELEDGTMGKINAAYSLGGPSGMVRQVSKLAGVDISHYAEIDFDSFMSLVDVVGGVEITLPVDVVDPDYTGLDLSAGTHTLDSHDALMLTRARHAYDEYGDGDLFRAANQRAIIASILRKVLKSSPQDMISSITAMAEGVTTDMSTDEILSLAAQFRDFDSEHNLYTGMTPSEPELIDEVYYEILDEDAWTLMMQRVDAGLPPYDSDEDDQTSGIASSTSEHVTVVPTSSEDKQTSRTRDDAKAQSLKDVDNSGAIAFLSVVDGRATAYAEELSDLGFNAVAYEEEDFTFDQNLVVYSSEAYQEEAEALASYLGKDYTAVLNDGSFYLISDIIVRIAV